jgi:hypothetical protein
MKQLLYITSGDRRAGLCSYVMQVIAMAKVCKEQNIPMYIDFSQDMLYYKDNRVTDNVWDYYFEQPFKNINVSEYEKIEGVWYQDNRTLQPDSGQSWMRYSKNSEFLKLARNYCKEFVIIKSELINICNNFLKNNTDGNYLAVHKRGCDHENQFALDNYFHETDKYIDRYPQLLVCSDEQYSIESYKARYGEKVISYNSVREINPAEAAIGVHYKNNNNNFVYNNGKDCIIEAYLMSQSKFLLKTVSNVSSFAVMLNQDLDFIWIDENYNCKY